MGKNKGRKGRPINKEKSGVTAETTAPSFSLGGRGFGGDPSATSKPEEKKKESVAPAFSFGAAPTTTSKPEENQKAAPIAADFAFGSSSSASAPVATPTTGFTVDGSAPTPAVSGISEEPEKMAVCNNCGLHSSIEKLQKCSRCLNVTYCNVEW